jgi:hypothetical protein
MLRFPIYTMFSAMVLGLVSIAEWRGWSLTRVNQLKDVPRTIRDNPGAYRSHYGYLPHRYIGGK